MKSKILYIGCLALVALNQTCVGQNLISFKEFYLNNFPAYSLPFSSDVHLKKFVKSNSADKSYLTVDKNEIIFQYLKRNSKAEKKPSSFIKQRFFPLFYQRVNETIVLVFDQIQVDSNGDSKYQCIAKSFSEDGKTIDSLKIAELSDYEGIRVRMFSRIADFGNIEIDYHQRNQSIDNGGKVLTTSYSLKINFSLSKGGIFYHANKQPYAFKTELGYSNLESIIREFHNKCITMDSAVLGDINGDGTIDLVSIVRRDIEKCRGREIDMIVSLGGYNGLFEYKGTQGGLDINSKAYKVGNLTIQSGLICIDIGAVRSNKLAKMYYSFNLKNRLCYLQKMEIFSNDKLDKEFLQDLNISITKSVNLAKESLHDQ